MKNSAARARTYIHIPYITLYMCVRVRGERQGEIHYRCFLTGLAARAPAPPSGIVARRTVYVPRRVLEKTESYRGGRFESDFHEYSPRRRRTARRR